MQSNAQRKGYLIMPTNRSKTCIYIYISCSHVSPTLAVIQSSHKQIMCYDTYDDIHMESEISEKYKKQVITSSHIRTQCPELKYNISFGCSRRICFFP